MCAMPWDEPLAPVGSIDGELAAGDRMAGDELMAALLLHWKALRSASPRWLREQFLLRDGKLEQTDDGWRLTIERRAQDVLLSKLPWGIGLIRLPWLPQLLHVHWSD